MEGEKKEAEAKVLISNQPDRLKYVIAAVAILVVMAVGILLYMIMDNSARLRDDLGDSQGESLRGDNAVPIEVEVNNKQVTGTE